MGRKFDVVYDDFTGGHFVGPNAMAQPANTWTGYNVTVTPDEGMLMPAGGWVRSDAITTSSNQRSAAIHVAADTGGGMADLGVAFSVGTTTYIGTAITGIVSWGSALSSTPGEGSRVTYDSSVDAFVFGSSSASTVMRKTRVSGAVTTITPSGTGNTFYGVWAWKDWYLYLGFDEPNKLYFSAPADLTSWPALNFIQVGSAGGPPIEAIVPRADDILVGTREAWWQISGVLGQTTTVRRITPNGPSPGDLSFTPPAFSAVESSVGIMHPSASPKQLHVLNGSLSVPAIAGFPEADPIERIVAFGQYAIGVTTGHKVWVWSDLARRWRALDPGVEFTIGNVDPVASESGFGSYIHIIGREFGGGVSTTYMYAALTDPTDLPTDETVTTFSEATVTLSARNSNAPFRVLETFVEYDFGGPSSIPRSAGVSVVTAPIHDMAFSPELDADGSVAPNSGHVHETNWATPTGTKRGHRVMVRYPMADTAPTFSAAPRIRMKGVKVRRVIMKCEDV